MVGSASTETEATMRCDPFLAATLQSADQLSEEDYSGSLSSGHVFANRDGQVTTRVVRSICLMGMDAVRHASNPPLTSVAWEKPSCWRRAAARLEL